LSWSFAGLMPWIVDVLMVESLRLVLVCLRVRWGQLSFSVNLVLMDIDLVPHGLSAYKGWMACCSLQPRFGLTRNLCLLSLISER